MCAPWTQRNWKYHTFSTVRGTSPLAFSVKFCPMNNFTELQLLPMMEFSFNILPRWFSIASLVSDFTADAFFVRKGAFYLNISTKKDTTKDKNINISSLKKDFKNLRQFLELINIEGQCSKNSFKIFLQEEAGAFRSNIGKEP